MEKEGGLEGSESGFASDSLSADRIGDHARIGCNLCSWGVLTLGLLVLVGWLWDLDTMKRVLPGHVSMNPVTALCFILAALSLWMQRKPFDMNKPSSLQLRSHRLSLIAAFTVLSVGMVVLLNYLVIWEINVDQFLFHDRLLNDLPEHPNRMAPNTAHGFILIGLALLLLNANIRRQRPAEFLALLTLLLSLLALMGYAYSVQRFYGLASYIPMALHTAVGFFLLSLGIFLARPHEGLMAIVSSDSSGGVLARRFLPMMLVVFALLGWFRLEAQRQGLYGLEMGVAIHTILNVLIFGILIWVLAKSFHVAEAIRAESRKKLNKLNADLLQRADQLAAANREIESFSYSVSHDLRAPLRSIAGFSEALENHIGKGLDEEARDYLSRVRRAAKRMEELIDDILKLSRLTRAEMKWERVDLSELAKAVVKDLEERDPGRKADWQIKSGLLVKGDRALLEAALVNLLGNAWKFTAHTEHPRIEFGRMRVTEEKQGVYYVRDNGAGFDMRYVNKLFGAFQRLHTTSEFPGNGIGLATVSRIIARHGGRIWAEGKENEGATFYFVL